MTATTITETQIRALRSEAAQAQDLAQQHICDVALGDEEPVTTADAWEDRYGGGGHAEWEREAVLACASQEQAWTECARVIADAAAQE